MAAAYVAGYSAAKDDLEAYPRLLFATGESDTGVIISWNIEGKKSVEENAYNIVVLPNELSINPSNWKLGDKTAQVGFFGTLSFHEDCALYCNSIKENVAKRFAVCQSSAKSERKTKL